jgi:hypothetical protein
MKLHFLLKAAILSALAATLSSCSSLGEGKSPSDRRANVGSETATARVQYLR